MKNNFECIYDEHVSCYSILKCTECGTVVFYHYDEDFEPDFECPICTNYKTHYKYWTKQEIEEDKKKQEVIKFYEKCDEISKEMDERYLERGNLDDWEKSHTKKLFKVGKLIITAQLQGQYDDKHDLSISLYIGKSETCGYIVKKELKIPLTFRTAYELFRSKLRYKRLKKYNI
jgi:uncharacterized Zn finger protein (UPF0148 family)